jgi:hypothetical protein
MFDTFLIIGSFEYKRKYFKIVPAETKKKILSSKNCQIYCKNSQYWSFCFKDTILYLGGIRSHDP